MARQAKLPDDEDIEWRAKRSGDLVAHRYTAARQCQDHDVLTSELPQAVSERRAGFTSVGISSAALRTSQQVHTLAYVQS
jgi:hypothetical protein